MRGAEMVLNSLAVHSALRDLTMTDKTAPSETIAEFCRAERISHGMYYKLKAAGKGPVEYYLGTHPRISPEAHAQWRREREAEAAAQ